MYIFIKSLRHTPETNVILYMKYISIRKEENRSIKSLEAAANIVGKRVMLLCPLTSGLIHISPALCSKENTAPVSCIMQNSLARKAGPSKLPIIKPVMLSEK